MSHELLEHLPWLLSAITIWMTLAAGNKARHAWLVGLFGQALWLAWIVGTKSWGFLPMNIALWTVYVRNHLKWRNEPRQPELWMRRRLWGGEWGPWELCTMEEAQRVRGLHSWQSSALDAKVMELSRLQRRSNGVG